MFQTMVIVLLLLQICIISLTSAKQLEFVQSIWRHGDRAPLSLPYPNDVYREQSWPRGWGQLTTQGMQQLHELGRFFRSRYPTTFVNASYIPSETYVRSSDTDRALVSAQAFLSGFYPASGSSQWQSGNNWQPIPVHAATPGEDDLLCKPTSISCPNAETIINQGETSDAATYNQKYADMFDLLANETGIPNFSYSDVNGIYDITREIANGDTSQPDWVRKQWQQYEGRTTLDICSELRTRRMVNQNGRMETGKFYGGYLLNQWIETAKAVAAKNMTSPSRMMLYSSHDNVVMALMATMGLADGIMPPYASSLIMEIYSDNNQYSVELFYRNSTSQPPVRLSIPGCGEPCLVEKMEGIYSNVTIQTKDQVMQLCGRSVSYCDDRNSSGLFSVVLPVIITNIIQSIFAGS